MRIESFRVTLTQRRSLLSLRERDSEDAFDGSRLSRILPAYVKRRMMRVNKSFNFYLKPDRNIYGAMAQWYSQHASVIEIAGLIPAPVINK